MSHLVFCDEFGNTGSNLFDLTQPVFVYGFLVLAQDQLAGIEADIRDLFREDGLPVAELKSSRLWASMPGTRRYLAIGELLAARSARICLSVVEKRYQACTMITGTYLDPAYNENAPHEIVLPKFAQTFSDAAYNWLDDARLKEFVAVVHDDDPANIIDVGRRISERLRLHPDDFVSHAAERMEARAAHVFRYAHRRPDLPRNSHIPASHYLAFQPAVERLDSALDTLDLTALLVRDADRQFGDLLDVAFSYAQKLDDMPAARAYGARRQLTRIVGCTDAVSAREFGVQLADLAAGLAGRVATAALADRPLDPAKQALLGSWRDLLLPPEVHYWIFADSTMPRVVSALFGEDGQ